MDIEEFDYINGDIVKSKDGLLVYKSDYSLLLERLRTAEQEREQYKAELQETRLLALQWQSEEHQKHLELESLRAKIKETQEQEPIAWCYPLDAENLKTTECIVEVYSIPVRRPDGGSTFALYSAPVIPD